MTSNESGTHAGTAKGQGEAKDVRPSDPRARLNSAFVSVLRDCGDPREFVALVLEAQEFALRQAAINRGPEFARVALPLIEHLELVALDLQLRPDGETPPMPPEPNNIPLSWGQLVVASLSAALAALCAIVGWPLPALALALLSFGAFTLWVHHAYSIRSRAQTTGGRWLSFLERMRLYLADEDGDVPASSESAMAPSATPAGPAVAN